MLGSVHDAEDALQEALLRAWRGAGRFEGRSSLRSWLYTIATNTCSTYRRRPKRVLPIDYGPAADPHGGPGAPLVESVWVEPYPDERSALEDGYAGAGGALRAARERRAGVRRRAPATCPPNQRAVLILREVLGFSASEMAESLDTTRRLGEQRAPARAQDGRGARCPSRASRRRCATLGDEQLREIVEGYMDAMERGDVEPS